MRRAVRGFAGTRPGAWLFARVLHRLDRHAYRLTGGRRTVTGVLAGLPVVMLTTTGARSGLARTVPVLGFPVAGTIVVAAGNFGRRHDPAWCRNLRQDPRAMLAVDGRTRRVVAEELTGAERTAAWDACLQVYPGGAAYAARAGGRAIGLFAMRPLG
jgi:deazaflavin-dependent oxidoreductase (nitroreductase family)